MFLVQIEVSSTENTELLEGLKGAGTALGIVTEMTFQLYDGISDVYAGNLILADDSNFTSFRY